MTPKIHLLPALLLTMTGALLFAPAASARDSTCLTGDDGKITVTTLEHRDPTDATATHRVTEITLIYGMRVLRGRLRDVDAGPVMLIETGSGKDKFNFIGTFRIDYDKMKMTLKGKLKGAAATDDPCNTTFSCKELEPNSETGF